MGERILGNRPIVDERDDTGDCGSGDRTLRAQNWENMNSNSSSLSSSQQSASMFRGSQWE